MKYPLPIHSYQHSSRPVGAERMVNCFAERAPPEGKAPVSVMRAPGTILACYLSNMGGRGLYAWNDSLYAVDGGTLWHISSDHSATSLGSISGTGAVSWAVNATQLVINAAPDAFYSDGASVTQITDADYTSRGGASSISIDGYILFREPNTGRFFSSDLDDAASYDALMFATAEGFPDNIVGMIADHRQAVLAGAQSMELYYNAGRSGFPFARDTNGFLELGCAAGNSLAKADNSIYWLASDLTVRRLVGLTPTRVSQHGVEQAIRSYARKSDAIGMAYTQDGHVFYVLTFPTDGHTWTYDVTTGEWHERESYGDTRWKPCATAFCYDRNYVQDYATGKIGYLDPDTYTEYGLTHRSSFTFANGAYNNGHRTFHSLLEVMAETGVGLTSGQGSDPQIMLEMSDDGGRTWRSAPNKSLGAIGRYRDKVRWWRLGSSRDRIYRCSVSDPVKLTVSDAALEVIG
jgi:hypothetical protein